MGLIAHTDLVLHKHGKNDIWRKNDVKVITVLNVSAHVCVSYLWLKLLHIKVLVYAYD